MRTSFDIFTNEAQFYKEDGEHRKRPKTFDEEISKRFNLGKLSSKHPPTVRLICNKIIHCNDFRLKERKNQKHFSWGGTLVLQGSLNNQNWKLEMNLTEFCECTINLLDALEEEYCLHSIYKYDQIN